jgi:hypothetical protein
MALVSKMWLALSVIVTRTVTGSDVSEGSLTKTSCGASHSSSGSGGERVTDAHELGGFGIPNLKVE